MTGSGRGADHGRIEVVTLSCPDLDTTVAAYVEVLEQRLVARGSVDTELATAWGVPPLAGRSMALLEPPSDSGFYLRLIEGPRPTVPPRTTHGWAALELSVRDADALHRRLTDDPRFRVLAAPRPLPGLPQIYPMQAEGPAGEVLYLNEIRGQLPDHDLPVAQCEIDRVFIVVLGAPDLDQAVDFYVDGLSFDAADAYEIPIGVLNDAFGQSADTRYRLQTTSVGRRLNVEVDQFPEMAVPRPVQKGELPAAMAMVSFAVDSLDGLPSPAVGPSLSRPEAPYLSRRAVVCRGAAGEWVELILRG